MIGKTLRGIESYGQEGVHLFDKEDLQNVFEIVLAAVKQNPLALSFASPRLKNNRFIVARALETSPLALSFASPELKNDRELQAIAKKTRN